MEDVEDRKTDDLEILRDAKQAAADRVKGDPSEKNLRALEKAIEMLNAATVEKPTEPEASYKNRLEAVAALKRRGYNKKQSTFYNHSNPDAPGPYLCRVEKDGSVLESSLEEYIKKNPRLMGKERPLETHSEKQRAELRKITAEARLLELKQMEKEGALIDREAFYMEFAGMVGTIESGLKYMLHMRCYRWAEMVLKDPENGSVLLLEAITKDLDDQFNSLARLDRFVVRFVEVREDKVDAG